MADTSTSAPTNYAEWEAAGGKNFTMPEAQPEAEQAETSEAADSSETAAEPEAAEEVPEQEQAEPKEQPPAKPKRTLSSDHAKMLKDLTEGRREKRELQQQIEQMQQQLRHPAPTAAQPIAPPVDDNDPPPEYPDISTFQGTLPEFEAETKKKRQEERQWLLRQWNKQQRAESQKAEAERITTHYQQRVNEHVKKHPNYLDEIGKTPFSDQMADVIMRIGPELAQLLINDKPEARRICGLPKEAQYVEMGRLIERLNTNGKKQPEPEPEEEDSQPVKVPAKLSGSPHSTPAWQRADRGAKNYAEWSAIGQRMANGRRK